MTREEEIAYWGRPMLHGGSLDYRARSPEESMDPEEVQFRKSMGIWHPALALSGRQAEREGKLMEQFYGMQEHKQAAREALAQREEAGTSAEADRQEKMREAWLQHMDNLGLRKEAQQVREEAAKQKQLDSVIAMIPNLSMAYSDPKQAQAVARQLIGKALAGQNIDINATPEKGGLTADVGKFLGGQKGGAPTTAAGAAGGEAAAPAAGGAAPGAPMGRDITGLLYGTDVAKSGQAPGWAIGQLYGGEPSIPEQGPAGYYSTEGKF